MKKALHVPMIKKSLVLEMRQVISYLPTTLVLSRFVPLLVFMAVLLSGGKVSAQTWSAITPPSGTTGFADIDFIDANNGALGLSSGGDVAWTTNGGATWSKNADISADMYSVDMVDANTMFAIGGGGSRVRTLNGGSTWDVSNIYPGHFHGGIRFATPSIGWAADYDGRLFKTTNSGASWTLQTNLGTIGGLVKGYVASTTVAYWPTHTSKTIKKTTDGTNWSTVYTASSANIECVTGLDANNVWAGLSNGTIVKTTDGGATWTSYSTGVNFQIFSIDFVSANEGWVVGTGGRIFYTSNGGVTWTQQTSGTTNDLYGLSMGSSNVGFACGNNQTLLKFTNCSAEINLQGGSPLTNIVDGDITPSTTDGTNFGNVLLGNSLARTFTIQNTGTSILTISSITSSNGLFTISGAPTAVAAGSSTTFTVTFSATATGVQNATITINNNDCNEGVYDFAITGTGCILPSFTLCPSTQNANTDANSCSATVTYNATATATITYAFAGVTAGSGNGTGSGSIFNKGTTTVTLTATNTCGTATCTFNVVVTDNTAPSITCPANIAVNNDAGQCGALVIYNTPAGVDNCSGAVTVQTGGLASGATVPIGTTTNTFRVTASNGQTATCSFTVTVTDNQIPVINCPADIEVGNDAGMCHAVVAYMAPVGTDNCSGASTVRTGGLASGATYPLGITTNTFMVTASNGQTASCAFTVTVSDTELPSVTCPPNKSVSQVQGSCISVATGIDALYSDNCAGVTLSYSSTGATTLSGTGQASGLTFDPGVTTVTYTATDASEQVSTCSFTVTMALCVQISGNIKWENNNDPVKSADVKLAVLPSLTQIGVISTDVNGNYTVIPGISGDYRIKPDKNTGLLNGVTAADATRVLQHIANNPPLIGPYKRIAADVNKNNSITSYDATLITQVLAGNPAAMLLFNTSWRFVPASYVFPSPTAPWGFPEKVDFTGLTASQTNVNFIGVKIGDVNGTANPLLKPVHPLVWMVNEAMLQEGEVVEATFRVGQLEDIASFQFALSFDTRELALEDIQTTGPLPLDADNFGTYASKDGEIRAVWAVAQGQSLKERTKVFTIRFRALNSGRKLSDLLHIEEAILHSAAYNTALNEAGVELVFTDAEVSETAEQDLTNRLILLQNQPNPTSGHTIIGFVLPQSCEAQLRIVDVNGRTVTEVNKQYPTGYQTESFDLSNYPGGVLYYELNTPYGSLVKKMMIVR